MTSEKKRNPALEHLIEGFNEEYISPFNYLLDQRGVSHELDFIKNKNKKTT